jgi:hypothetical protein
VPLKRLTPVVQSFDLGCLRLWQDELAEIVRRTRMLDDAKVSIEADDYELDDMETELAEIGPRLEYFSVTATKATGGQEAPRELVSIRLSRDDCRIQAPDPDLTTIGLINEIRALARRSRRLPRWLPALTADLGITLNNRTGLVVRTIIAAVLAAVGTWISGLVIAGLALDAIHRHERPLPVWAFVLVTVMAVVTTLAASAGVGFSSTLMITATHREAPTFWQRHRAEITIAIVVGALFYGLGLATAHL